MDHLNALFRKIRNPRYWGTFCFLCFVSLFFQACYWNERKSIRIAVNIWPGYEHLFLAREEGFYKEAGVNIQLIEFGSLGDVQRALEWKQVDGIACSLIDILFIEKQIERPLGVVLLPSYPVDGADVLLAKKEILHLEELKGKRIGVEVGTLGIYMIARALQFIGLKLSDVHLVPADPSSMYSLLEKKHIDAAVCYAPYSTVIEQNDAYRVIFSSAQIPQEVIDVIAIEKDVIERDREAIVRFLKAWNRAIAYAKLHPKQACSIMSERENVSLEAFEAAYKNVRILTLEEQLEYFTQESYWSSLVNKVTQNLQSMGILSGNHESHCTLERDLLKKAIERP